MRRLLPSLFLLTCLPASLLAANPTLQAYKDADRRAKVEAVLPQVDQLFSDNFDKAPMPGLVYGVMLDGQLIHVKAKGQADIEGKLPVAPESRFRIASMTKSFAAMAVIKLRDAGKLQLDDPVGKYIPDFAKVGLPTADSPVITLRHLLTMTGGFATDDPWADREMEITDAQLAKLLRGGLQFSDAPGQRFEYANLGYILLGHVITRVAKMPFQDYITQNILLPLGMRDTVWEYTKVPKDKLALGYHRVNDAWVREPILHDGTGAAMGGLITTMADFSRYVAFHMDAWPVRDAPETGPLKRASVREMQMPHVISRVNGNATMTDGKTPNPSVAGYGYGLISQRDNRGMMTVTHAGGLPGYGSLYRFAPEHGVAVIAFCNKRYCPVYQPASYALDLIMEKAALERRAIPPSALLLERSEQFVGLLKAWDTDRARTFVANNFFLDDTPQGWETRLGGLMKKLGKVEKITPVQASSWLKGRFKLVGEDGDLNVSLQLTSEKEARVQSVDLNFVPKAAAKAQ